MIPIEDQPILTAAQMRAAEEASGVDLFALMRRAGEGVAEAIRRLAAGREALILCGPGNNGGDGYVAARVLREAGHPVRVAALADPGSDLARRAREQLTGPVEPFPMMGDRHASAPVLVDAVFGTGLSRPVDERVMTTIDGLVRDAQLSVAVDLPTGVDADTGMAPTSTIKPKFDLTLALGALKPAHVLMPATERCGARRLIDLGLKEVISRLDLDRNRTIAPFAPEPLPRDTHKYRRGLVLVIAGAMPGAAALAVTAAMRAGAGYGVLLSDTPIAGLPHAVVQKPWSLEELRTTLRGKPRSVVVAGPGLGRDDAARAKLDAAIAVAGALVIDGDALHLLRPDDYGRWRGRTVLTPHAGEFEALFGKPTGSKIAAARAAAETARATVVFKGADTVIGRATGHTNTLVGATPWLATAGSGDVLAGTIAGLWQATASAPEAGVWLHGEAARRCGPAFIADDLAFALSAARAAL